MTVKYSQILKNKTIIKKKQILYFIFIILFIYHVLTNNNFFKMNIIKIC